MEPLTIKELLELCKKEVEKGNGNKVIMTANDDEGNGYHYMYYPFSTIKQASAEEFVNEDIASKEDTIVLG